MCSVQRPLDTKSQLRVVLEAEAVVGVISLAEAGEVSLVFSEAHDFETKRNPHPTRKQYALEVAGRAARYLQADEAGESRANDMISAGIKSLDALHLALAVEAGVDYFCTCDDRLYRKAKRANTRSTKVVTPLELIEELENGDPDASTE